MMKKRSYASLYIPLAIIICFAIYNASIGNYSILDDVNNLKPLNSLKDDPGNWYHIVTSNTSGPFGRSVSMASFIIDYLISPNDYGQFKRSNILIHLLCGIIGFFTFRLLIKQTILKDKTTILAIVIFSLWLFSPLNVSTVLYSVQRMSQLSCLFVLCSILAYTFFRQHKRSSSTSFQIFAIFLALIMITLATFSKENGLLGIPLILLIEKYFFNFGLFKSSSKDKIISLSYYLLLSIILITIIILIINFDKYVISGYSAREFNLIERMLSQVNAVGKYAINIIMPNVKEMTIFHDDFPISRSLFDSYKTSCFLFVFIAISVYFIITKNIAHKLASFGFIFFFVAHSMESTIFPLELYFEHRNYLPMWGLHFCIAIIIVECFNKLHKYKPILLLTSITYSLILLTSLYLLTSTWKSRETLVVHSLNSHPKSIRANIMRASDLVEQNKYNESIIQLTNITSHHPNLLGLVETYKMHIRLKQNIYPEKASFDLIINNWPQKGKYSISASAILAEIASEIIAHETKKANSSSVQPKQFMVFIENVLEYNSDKLGHLAKWQLHNAAALMAITCDHDNSIYHLFSAWKYIPKDPYPGIELAHIIMNKKNIAAPEIRAALDSIIDRLKERTSESDFSTQKEISKIEEKKALLLSRSVSNEK